jgi:hypothetical protein
MKYLGIIYCLDSDSGETFTLSREVDTDDKKTVYDLLKSEAQCTDDDVDVILLVKSTYEVLDSKGSGPSLLGSPEVHKFWRAGGGDFAGL